MMKRIFFLLSMMYGSMLFAAPGDTTIVQTFSFEDGKQPAWTWQTGTFVFPAGEVQYEKVLMIYTLKCDPNSNPACGEWDFLVHTQLGEDVTTPADTQTVYRFWELGKYVTPYGYGIDLGNNGWTWVYDVSDFVHLLKDTVLIRDMNFQEILDLKFMFIEGIPPRNVVDIQQIWQRDVYLNVFDDIVKDTTIQLKPETRQVKLRTTLTGHEFSNNTNCAEFCPKIHSVQANGTTIANWQIIQSCATNPLYPQGGTWLYDRAGWCPGMVGTLNEFELTPYILNNSVNFDYDIQYDQYGYYNTHIELVSYGDINFTDDVTAELIISPTNDKLQSRFNPTCGNAFVVIKNIGSHPLTAATIRYSIGNSINEIPPQLTYNWTGNLHFLEKDTIKLTGLNWNVIEGNRGVFSFEVSNPNGMEDPTPYNNHLSAAFDMPTKIETTQFQFHFQTNHAPDETSWTLTDAWGDTLYRNGENLTANTLYKTDMVLESGCYKLKVQDIHDDGLKFWANMPPNGNGTAGYAMLRKISSNGTTYAPFKTINPDFGRFAQIDFAVNQYTGLEEKHVENAMVKLYPNPAQISIFIEINGAEKEQVIAELYDMFGRLLKVQPFFGSNKLEMAVNELSQGIYIVVCREGGKVIGRNKFVVSGK